MMELLQFSQPFIDGILAKKNSFVPSVPIVLGYSVNEYHKETGISAPEIMRDGKKIAQAQLFIAKKLNIDFLISCLDLNVIGEAYGTELSYPIDSVPMLEKGITDMEKLESLEVLDPTKDGRLPINLEAARICSEKFKKENLFTFAGSEGPFTAAGAVMGAENLMRNIIKNPDLVHKVIDVCTDSIIEYYKAYIDEGLPNLFGITEPTASVSCISPEHFREFVAPYIKRIVKKVDISAWLLHICGESEEILDQIVKLPRILIFSCDKVDLKKVKQIIGKKFICVLGNVPTQLLMRGTPQQIELTAKKCIEEAAPGGKFILSSGCDIGVGTPQENIQALINAPKKYGKYPIG
ncbi:MAG: uroporphyrinogen decarboxylase family protein [Candidatus Helarchaeota archaeon]